jgi:hypothetical protein
MQELVLRLGIPASVCLVPLAIGLLIYLRGRKSRHFRARRAVFLFGVAGLLGAMLAWASAMARLRLALDPRLIEVASTLLGFHILVEAPCIETSKAILVWRAYRRGFLSSVRVGAMHGALVGAGFALGEIGREFYQSSHPLPFLEVRLALCIIGHVFFSAGWAALLSRGGRDRFFGVLWLILTAFHGLFRHVVFERPASQLALLLPLVLLMGGVIWLTTLRPSSRPFVSSRFESARAFMSERFEVDGPEALVEALNPARRRSSFLWIVFGSLVTLGVTLTFLTAVVLIGNRLGADFSLLDDASLTRIEPLLLLGGALLLAFPFSAFLVARASAAESVVEPAWATALAVILVLVLFSVTEPSAVIVALALAPVAFVLGCVGAWAGVDSRPSD